MVQPDCGLFSFDHYRVTGIVFAVLGYKYDLSRARAGLGMLGLLGLLGLPQLLFRKKTNQVDMDERDLFISRKSSIIAYSVFWVSWVLGSMAAWAVIGPSNYVPITVLPLTVLIGGIIFWVVQSIAILAQYGFKEKNHE